MSLEIFNDSATPIRRIGRLNQHRCIKSPQLAKRIG